jgi:glycosyltransferase involved in cell wall biosynthesis
MESPLVSVIIPTYNRLNYLQTAIASVLHQTVQDFEIIVSDDCSFESPEALIRSFNDPRIQLRRNVTNLGIARNAMSAFQMANGKYVASLNDDDVWTEQFLEKLLPPLENHPELVLSFCDYAVIDATGTMQPEWTEQQTRQENRDRLSAGIYHPFWEVGLVNQSIFASCAAVLRRAAIRVEDLPNAGVFWDYYLVYLACRTGGGAYYYPERLTQYRRHSQSENMLSGSRDAQAKIRKGKAGIFCYEQFANHAPEPWMQKYFWREWAHANTTLAIGLMREGRSAEARPYLMRSLLQQPLNPRTLIASILSYIPQSIAMPISHLRDPGLLSRAR